jgi:hypothetical protein
VILNAYPHIVVATITEALGPVDRGAIYADPIDAALTTAGIGTVTGGGSQLDANGIIAFVDIEAALANLDGALERFRELLQQLGAPSGSVLTFTRDGTTHVISVATGAPATSPAGAADAFARRLLDLDHEDDDTDEDEDEDDAFDVPEYDPAIIRQTAEQVRASYRSLMVDSYAVGPITRSAYDRDLFVWYDERTAEFERHGFTAHKDLKNVADASKPEPGAGPFARRFSTRDHTHRADIFQVRTPGGDYIRVMDVVTELSDGSFIWTCSTQPRWDAPPHTLMTYVASDIPVHDLLAGHDERVNAHLRSRRGVTITPLATLQDLLASENRCQKRTADFRRQQQVPSIDELVRLGSEPHLATLVHAELQQMVAASPAADRAIDGEWNVTTVDLPAPKGGPMSFETLIEFALDQGTTQVAKAGSPLNAFLIYDTGRAHFFVCLSGDGDPVEIALRTLQSDTVQPQACALVIDTRITMADGKKTDAIIAMASQRGVTKGVTWAQAYRPKGIFRSFKVLPMREEVGTSRNLFDEAAATV